MTDTTPTAGADDVALTLDQLLTDAAARPDDSGLKSNPFARPEPWATANQVAGLREAAATAELTLDGLLAALDALFGAGCTVRIRAELADLEGCVHHLADVAAEALATAADDRAHLDGLRTARERARAVAVLLEGALSAADERERRVRGILADIVRDGVNGIDVSPDARAVYGPLAVRLRLALDFDGDADPATLDPADSDSPAGDSPAVDSAALAE